MINLLFTTFEPMVSLASLLGLPNIYTQFYGLPDVGSSMVFEMFTANSSTSTYPAAEDLRVRFLFRNGTDNGQLAPYAIFGEGETMTLNDFTDAMSNVMMADVGQWCHVCQSGSVFCPFYTNLASGSDPSSSSSSASKANPAIRPAVAGVIGAIIALIIAGAVFIAAMLIFGVRFKRVKTARKSTLGGFKGSEKLASDVDVSVVKGGVGASVVGKGEGMGEGKGERVGSWELREGRVGGGGGLGNGKGGRASFEGDGDGGSVRGGKPVEVKEVV